MLALALLALLAATALSGCSDESPSAGPSLVAPEGFTAVTLLVTRADGEVVEWCVWLADDAAERARGLMEVTDPGLGGRAGMAFVWPDDTSGSFYMRNTRLPLSIAFIDASGRVVSEADMEPCPDEVADCPLTGAAGPYRWALEVPQGGLARLGIEEDSTLRLAGDCASGPSSAPTGAGPVAAV
ncbi:MAG: DUF192 domain-containing protein [Acidimicrobiales bacterium]|nr:DUF192 domain-containing protein [Acidimicrobiales bacterium]